MSILENDLYLYIYTLTNVKGKTLTFHEEKLSSWETTRRLHRSEHLNRIFLKNPSEYGKKYEKQSKRNSVRDVEL